MRFRRSAVALAGVLAIASVAACSSDDSDASPRSATTGSTSGNSIPTAAATGAVATSVETLTTPDGRTRTFRVVVPASVEGRGAVPLVLALHGGLGSGRQFERTSGFDALATRDHFIVVYPDGIEIGGATALAKGQVWNGGSCCGRAAREDVDDVGFLRAVLDRVERDHQVDPRRVYAAGHSNGAIMAYRLACQLSDRIVAIGIQAGAIEVDGCAPARPVSVLAIHGTADTNIPIDGGQGTGISGAIFSSPVDAITSFARFDRCGTPATETSPHDPNVRFEKWTACTDGTGVEFVRVAGATHAWMGHPAPRASQTLTGAPYQGFDSTVAIWEFLAGHPRRG